MTFSCDTLIRISRMIFLSFFCIGLGLSLGCKKKLELSAAQKLWDELHVEYTEITMADTILLTECLEASSKLNDIANLRIYHQGVMKLRNELKNKQLNLQRLEAKFKTTPITKGDAGLVKEIKNMFVLANETVCLELEKCDMKDKLADFIFKNKGVPDMTMTDEDYSFSDEALYRQYVRMKLQAGGLL